MKLNQFAQQISSWGSSNLREMPWKGEKDPYLIWLSEIILQQTRVAQGLDYFLRFKKTFPTVFDLAAAKQEQVLKLWEGLGYYSRARNLHFTAKYIVSELKGVFPKTAQELLQLKGVGPYTSAAIASFAYGENIAVVDGNVIRVLSRYFGLENALQSAKEKKSFQDFADEIVAKQNSAVYNQAIMDFGAQICTPKQVDCSKCFLTEDCFAFRKNKQLELPLTQKKPKLKERFFSFLILNFEDEVYIEQRSENDIWKGLHQFPKIETFENNLKSKKEIEKAVIEKIGILDFEIIEVSENIVQKLTHQKISANFIKIKLKSRINKVFLNTNIKNLSKFAFPKIINVYLGNKRLK